MRIPLAVLTVCLALCLGADAYIYMCLRRRCRNRVWTQLQVWASLACYAALATALLLPRRDGDNAMLLAVMWLLYAVFSVYVPKYLFVAFDLVARLPQLWGRQRIKAVTRAGAAVGVAAFLAMWCGALAGRFMTQVKQVEVEHADVPGPFDGYRMVQISDLHTGTYGTDTAFTAKLVDRINALKPDLVVFTGDLVNQRTDELYPHQPVLSRLHAPDGVMSVLGNHDYGDYSHWPTPQAKARNLEQMRQMQRAMGWQLLDNANAVIHRGGDSIAVLGVENIGDPPFKVYGSLGTAASGTEAIPFRILLTHNPSHWTDSIAGRRGLRIPITLSGHTHAMQAEVAGISPAALRYKTWGGMYADADSTHRLYVNIGAGTVGFPARIGATPEITLITLRRKAD